MATKKADTSEEVNEVTGEATTEVSAEVSDVNLTEENTTAAAGTPAVQNTAVVEEPVGFYAYLGPTIHGLIQSGTIYEGDPEKLKQAIAPAIAKYPQIKGLIVTDKTFVGDRIKVKTAGNVLNERYKKLVKLFE